MKLLRDTWLMFQRYLEILLRNPAWVVIGVLQPVMYLVLFAPLLKSMAATPGFPPGGAYNVFVPGLLIQLGLFGASGVGFGLIAELRAGVIERFRVTPVTRFALLLGRALRDILTLVVQGLILLLLSIPFGLQTSIAGVVVLLALVALIGLGMASIAYACALWLRSEDAYAPLVFSVSLPLLLLSGVLLPLQLAPAWLRNIAALNPLSYAVQAGRDLFNGHSGDPDVLKGLVIMAVLAVVGIWVGSRAFSRAVA
ncbi:MAG TPA: ABC transporter permease [Candidatus Solibacter sp.]|jgi:ABC-2 type transport system permease protein|nr:ABC transporter permease [Candidatus Solibacter sp.]